MRSIRRAKPKKIFFENCQKFWIFDKKLVFAIFHQEGELVELRSSCHEGLLSELKPIMMIILPKI